MKKNIIFGVLLTIVLLFLISGLINANLRINKLEENQSKFETLAQDAREQINEETLIQNAEKQPNEEISTQETVDSSTEETKTIQTGNPEDSYIEYMKLKYGYNNDEMFKEDTKGGIVFYADPECTEEIGNSETLTFRSSEVDWIKVNIKGSERDVYVVMLYDGAICYCKGDQYPKLYKN